MHVKSNLPNSKGHAYKNSVMQTSIFEIPVKEIKIDFLLKTIHLIILKFNYINFKILLLYLIF
jgi:hypothetical protein